MAPASPGVTAGTDGAPGPRNPLRDPRDRRIPRVAGPCVLVMFGVTGDLARKKLMPAIYDLANRGLLPPGFSFVGFARRDWENEDFAQVTYQAVKEYARTPFRDAVWEQLSEGVRFVSGSFDDDAAFDELADTVMKLDAERGTGGNYAFYLSIPPGQFPTVVRQLKRSGLSDSEGRGWRRVVIEKPFGHDLASARELNATLEGVFPPEAVFRIDHYLGKETVQNILALRFANEMYEPIWNRGYVDHVQITMVEDIGIGGGRLLRRHRCRPRRDNGDLDEAMGDALDGMLLWMQSLYDLDKAAALALASPAVDLRVTQVANERGEFTRCCGTGPCDELAGRGGVLDWGTSGGAGRRHQRRAAGLAGTRDAQPGRDNVIIYPCSYTADHAELAWLIGPDAVLDPTRWFIVIPDMFSNGLSSGASDTEDYPAVVTMADNVRAQHRLLSSISASIPGRRLRVLHGRGPGLSLGRACSLSWSSGRSSCAAAPVPRSHNKVFLSGLLRTLEAAPEYLGGGRFSSEPAAAVRAFAHIYAGWGLSQDFYRERLFRTELGEPRPGCLHQARLGGARSPRTGQPTCTPRR